MRLNFKNVLKNTSVLTALSILTVLYVLSAYFILHTTWIYENPNSYLNDHAEYYALLLSVAFFFLFLPFGITAYHYKLMKSGNTLSALIKGIFYFLSINAIADLFVAGTLQGVFSYALFFVFAISPSGILYLWTHLDLNQRAMTFSQDTQNNITSILSKFTFGKTISVSDLRQTLDQQVIGQSYAKEEIVKQLITQVKKAQAVGRNVRVLGTFFFVGPTGVGKTESAKAIYEYFKRSGYQFLRFDMGNFANPQDAATLTGSPRGYVGSTEGGALTRPLMSNPKAVILFDEMEKADPTLFRTFMTLIDEGEIQETSTGKRVTLNNAIIIFTSNLYQGSIKEIITKEKDPIAAELAIRNLLTGNYYDALKYVSWEQIQMEKPPDRYTSHGMTSKFPPEFIGRIDKVVPFTSLSVEDYKVIVRRLAKKYKKNVDVDAITKKNLPIAEKYGVRQFIKKVEEDILA
jgi:ATPases with chaperone activity, ATP-binding subunit